MRLFDPSHVAHDFNGKLDEIRQNGSAIVNLASRTFDIRKDFLDDIAQAHLAQAIPRLKAALLVLHAPRDAIVGINNAGRIFGAAKHAKSDISLDGADQMLTRAVDAEYTAEVIASWSRRYLDLLPDPVTAAAPKGIVRVAEAEVSGFRQDVVVAGRHALVVDEPVAMGGTDLGPSPYQLLAAALGACSTMTLRMYARRKNMPLVHVSCDVSHDRCHTADCAGAEAPTASVDVFSLGLRLTGDLTEDQRAALLAIVGKCPVHRTLTGQAVVRKTLAAT